MKDIMTSIFILAVIIFALAAAHLYGLDIGRKEGRLGFYEDIHGKKLECRLTADAIVTDKFVGDM